MYSYPNNMSDKLNLSARSAARFVILCLFQIYPVHYPVGKIIIINSANFQVPDFISGYY